MGLTQRAAAVGKKVTRPAQAAVAVQAGVEPPFGVRATVAPVKLRGHSPCDANEHVGTANKHVGTALECSDVDRACGRSER